MMMPVNGCSIHRQAHLFALSIKVSKSMRGCTYTHMQTHKCALTYADILVPVWIISGFPQWVIKPVHFSPLSLTFPSELPTTVGLITHSSNTYLSAQ